MAEQRFNPENIIELAEELRLAGFDIGTQQYIAAQDLLIALAAHNRLPADPFNWRSLLAPIFCASPAEQEEFYGRFDLWLKRHPEWRPVPEDLPEPGPREITLPAASILWLRKPLGMVTVSLLILLIGFAVFLLLKTNRTLTGEVISIDELNRFTALPEAQVEFFNQTTKTDKNGKFTITYQARNWHRVFNRQTSELKVSHSEHEPNLSTTLDVHRPSHQKITLQKRQPKIPNDPTVTPPPVAETAPTPIPQTIRWHQWMLVASPLLAFAVWLLLRWRRRRALLQKLQAAGSPNLRRLTVRGAAEQLFQSLTFRRAVQDLRRHRRVETKELDIPGTVRATINRGGMFQPLYGSRKALPEYLLLIDRASPADEQARFADELSQRLEAGGVFVDRFYFQNDPRTCRQREPNSPTVTLLDLAARYPEHQLLIFSDGAGFISPLTGEAEHWLASFSHWPRRVLLTPEQGDLNGYCELELTENDFLVLPANDDGLAVLTETISADELPNLKTRQGRNGDANPFPRLILERPKRWLERHEPRPAMLNELRDQLRAYLGEDGWYWMAACAVYPALSWDVTLYLGYKLFGNGVSSPTVKEGLDRVSSPTVSEGLSFEERLLRLVRLPWFRYSSMPDWLRMRLIESFSPEQESEVRQTIESMLLSALEHPREGIPLEIAERQHSDSAERAEPGNWLRQWKAKLDEWRGKRKLADLIEKEPEGSPLRDFVFLGFLSGGRARRLTVKLPDVVNRLLFPQGQPVLGFRLATAFLLAVLAAMTIQAMFMIPRPSETVKTNTPQPPTVTSGTINPSMPNLVGVDVLEAEKLLFGIAPNVQVAKKELEQFTPNYSAGVVIEQMPDAGAALNSESRVALLYNPQKNVSSTPGIILVTVPDLRGRTYAEASNVLASVKLRAEAVVNEQININNYNVTGQRPLLGALLAVGGTVYLAVEPPKPQYPKMPNVVGQHFNTARSMLLQRQPNSRISLSESPRLNPSYRPGAVIYQSLKEGTDLNPGVGVTLVYNSQQPKATVPDVMGLTVPDAVRKIQQSNLIARLSGRGNFDSYRITGQSPQAGTVVEVRSPVTLTVAATIVVPDVRRSLLKEAQQVISQNRLTVGSVTTRISSVRPDEVLSQSPAPNSVVVERTAVNLVIARIQQVQVPNVLNQKQGYAEQLIAKARLTIGQVTTQKSPLAAGTVLAQNPSAGTMVNVGSRVNLIIATP